MGIRQAQHAAQILALLAVALLLAACGSEPPAYQYTGYLAEEIPPCQPAAGSSTDPCASQEGQQLGGSEASLYFGDDEPFGVEHFVYGFSLTSSTHLIVRGTYLPNSVRCAPAGAQWRLPTFVETDYSHLTATHCFADIRVNEYILGSGPPALTVQVEYEFLALYNSTDEEREEARLRLERLLLEGGLE